MQQPVLQKYRRNDVLWSLIQAKNPALTGMLVTFARSIALPLANEGCSVICHGGVLRGALSNVFSEIPLEECRTRDIDVKVFFPSGLRLDQAKFRLQEHLQRLLKPIDPHYECRFRETYPTTTVSHSILKKLSPWWSKPWDLDLSIADDKPAAIHIRLNDFLSGIDCHANALWCSFSWNPMLRMVDINFFATKKAIDDIKKNMFSLISPDYFDKEKGFLNVMRLFRLSGKLNFSIEEKAHESLIKSIQLISQDQLVLDDDDRYKLLTKISECLANGAAERTFDKLEKAGMVKFLLPELARCLQQSMGADNSYRKYLMAFFKRLDNSFQKNSQRIYNDFTIAALLWPVVLDKLSEQNEQDIGARIDDMLDGVFFHPLRISELVKPLVKAIWLYAIDVNNKGALDRIDYSNFNYRPETEAWLIDFSCCLTVSFAMRFQIRQINLVTTKIQVDIRSYAKVINQEPTTKKQKEEVGKSSQPSSVTTTQQQIKQKSKAKTPVKKQQVIKQESTTKKQKEEVEKSSQLSSVTTTQQPVKQKSKAKTPVKKQQVIKQEPTKRKQNKVAEKSSQPSSVTTTKQRMKKKPKAKTPVKKQQVIKKELITKKQSEVTAKSSQPSSVTTIKRQIKQKPKAKAPVKKQQVIKQEPTKRKQNKVAEKSSQPSNVTTTQQPVKQKPKTKAPAKNQQVINQEPTTKKQKEVPEKSSQPSNVTTTKQQIKQKPKTKAPVKKRQVIKQESTTKKQKEAVEKSSQPSSVTQTKQQVKQKPKAKAPVKKRQVIKQEPTTKPKKRRRRKKKNKNTNNIKQQRHPIQQTPAVKPTLVQTPIKQPIPVTPQPEVQASFLYDTAWSTFSWLGSYLQIDWAWQYLAAIRSYCSWADTTSSTNRSCPPVMVRRTRLTKFEKIQRKVLRSQINSLLFRALKDEERRSLTDKVLVVLNENDITTLTTVFKHYLKRFFIEHIQTVELPWYRRTWSNSHECQFNITRSDIRVFVNSMKKKEPICMLVNVATKQQAEIRKKRGLNSRFIMSGDAQDAVVNLLVNKLTELDINLPPSWERKGNRRSELESKLVILFGINLRIINKSSSAFYGVPECRINLNEEMLNEFFKNAQTSHRSTVKFR